MKYAQDIRPVTFLKSRSAELLEQINNTRRPVVITQNGEARAVIQDTESYENMVTSIGLLKLIAQGEQDVRAGGVETQENVFSKIESKLKRQK